MSTEDKYTVMYNPISDAETDSISQCLSWCPQNADGLFPNTINRIFPLVWQRLVCWRWSCDADETKTTKAASADAF